MIEELELGAKAGKAAAEPKRPAIARNFILVGLSCGERSGLFGGISQSMYQINVR